MHSFVELPIETLPQRGVSAARLVIELWQAAGPLVVARDAENGQYVRVCGLQLDPDARVLSLSPDGRHLVILGGRQHPGLYVHTLATGQQRWLASSADDQDAVAALSPDTLRVATLTTTYDDAAIDHILLANGQRHRVWSVPGGWSDETAISWSPDSQLLAATYLTEDDELATIVIDAAGTPVGHYDGMRILPSSNGTWLGDRQLFGVDSALQLTTFDIDTSSTAPISAAAAAPLAFTGGRLLNRARHDAGEQPGIMSSALDGTDRRPLLGIGAHWMIRMLDIATHRPQIRAA